MPDRQIAQLVLQVDANIAVAQRELQALARAVRQQAGEINNSLATTEVAHQRLGHAFGQARIAQMELSHVVTASVDAYAAGAPPLRIMTLEMGRLAQAATFLGGSGGGGVLGKFASFMSGGWGIAVLLGVSALSQLIAKHGETAAGVDDLVEKLKQEARQAELSKQAHQIFANTLDGLREAARLNREELDKLGDSDRSAATKALAHALARKETALAIIAETEANISLARSLYEVQKARASGPGQRSEIAALGLEGKLGALDAFQSRLAATKVELASASRDIAEATSRIDVEAASRDPVERIKKRYDRLIEQARQRAVAENKVGDALIRQVAALERQREAKIKAASRHESKGPGEFGKQLGFAEASDIARAAGLSVTSAYRSSAHQAALYNDPSVNRPGNPVARPGTSAHEGVNGKWALDIAFAPGLTAEKLKKIYGAQGVSLSAVYKEKGHFHIEGSRAGAADEARAERDRLKGIRDQGAFAQFNDRLDQELAQAKQQLTGDYHQLATLAADQVDAETKKLTDSIREQQDLGSITAVQSVRLQLKVQELALDKKALIQRREFEQQDRDAQALADQKYQFQVEDLRFADEMATTQAAHRKLQLDILDVVYQQKLLDLEYAKAQAERNQNLAEANRIQGQIDRLPTDKAQDQSRVRQGTMDPLEQWARTVPKTATEINEALHSIEAQGLDSLADALSGVVTGTESLGKAFKNVANEIIGDILRMTVRMLIFKAISSLFGQSTATPTLTNVTPVIPTFSSQYRAAGGPVSRGEPYIVGEGGRPELFVPPTNGVILPRVPRISVARPAKDAGPPSGDVHVHQTFEFQGVAVTHEEFVRGLIATKGATLHAIREARRRQ